MSTPNPVNEILSFTVPEQFGGFRLDLCLVRFCPERSRSRIQTLIAENHVKVNGAVCGKAKTAVAAGDVIELENIPDELPPQEAEPENIPLQVLYEDDFLLAVNKSFRTNLILQNYYTSNYNKIKYNFLGVLPNLLYVLE